MNETQFNQLHQTQSDINEHLPTLVLLLQSISSTHPGMTRQSMYRYPVGVVELGVRSGVSSRAFLYAGYNSSININYVGYDLHVSDETRKTLEQWARACTSEVRIVETDIRQLSKKDIPFHDVLMIDSLHTADQVRHELTFTPKTRCYIVLHDTVTFGDVGEDGGTGIMAPITEFLSQSPQWRIFAEYRHNNGLMILKRNTDI